MSTSLKSIIVYYCIHMVCCKWNCSTDKKKTSSHTVKAARVVPNGHTSNLPYAIGTASAHSLESDLGCTSRVYFDNLTLTSQKPCQHSNKNLVWLQRNKGLQHSTVNIAMNEV